MFLTRLPVNGTMRVIEIGPGSSPHYQATILVDKFIASGHHRHQSELHRDGRPLVCADSLNMPFRNQSVDYVICRNVLEHVENPERCIKEMERIASAGYIETPNFLCETFFGYKMHQWILIDVNGELRIKRKNVRYLLFGDAVLGESFQKNYHLYKFYVKNIDNLFLVKYFWRRKIRYRICADHEPIVDYANPAEADAISVKILAGQGRVEKMRLAFCRLMVVVRGKFEWEYQKFIIGWRTRRRVKSSRDSSG